MSAPINVRDLLPGTSVVLASGAEAEIVDNPQDGIWLFARYLSSPRDPTLVGQEEMVFAQDVVAVGRSSGEAIETIANDPHSQSLAVARSDGERDDQDFIDSVSDPSDS